jgi:hypothetical protein
MISLLTTEMSIINNSNCSTTLKSQTLNVLTPLTKEQGKVQYEPWMDRKLAYELFRLLS